MQAADKEERAAEEVVWYEVMRYEVCAVRWTVHHNAKRRSTRIQQEDRGGEHESCRVLTSSMSMSCCRRALSV
jgi:hypothetical protein